MIRAIISRDAVLRARLEAVLEGAEGIDSVLIIPEYPHSRRSRFSKGFSRWPEQPASQPWRRCALRSSADSKAIKVYSVPHSVMPALTPVESH
jgi:hypothetical protein